MYSPDGTNVYGSIGGEFEQTAQVQEVESRKIVLLGDFLYSRVQTLAKGRIVCVQWRKINSSDCSFKRNKRTQVKSTHSQHGY